MDSLEGTLMIPPDRGQILGRAVWKPRHVVVRRRAPFFREHQSTPSYTQIITTSRITGSANKPTPPPPRRTDEYHIAISKAKDDAEPYQQWPVSSVTDCQVQMLAKRKQGPALPTLVITIQDRERKRRSSRAGSFMPPVSKDNGVVALWFRLPSDEEQPSLQDWARFINSQRDFTNPEDSPITPTSSTQTFSPRQRDTNDYFPPSGSSNFPNRHLQHKSSTATYSTSTTGARERPMTFSSHSPSLRSKRSDVSSPSSNYPPQQASYPIPGQHYTTVLPTDLPSPVNTTSEFQNEPIDGRTPASAVSSPRRGRESLGSNAIQSSIAESSSPPGPRETILDRAFQMRYLQKGDRGATGEEQLSSVARFDALMREADSKRKEKAATAKAEQAALRSAFEADDSSESDPEQEDTDSDDGDFSSKQDLEPPLIPQPAQRALEYLTGRPEVSQNSSSRPGISRNQLSFNADSTPLSQAPPARPHTAHAKSRRDLAQRAQSTQYLPSSSSKHEDDKTPRQSSSSTKRLSFTEFTKRLSSTSSLLLVQTNASGASSQRSSEGDFHASTIPRTSLKPPGPGAPQQQYSRERDPSREEQDRPCGWRNSIGVVGSEGGFF